MGHNKGQTMWRWSWMKSNSILQIDCGKLTHHGYCETTAGKQAFTFKAERRLLLNSHLVQYTYGSTKGLNVFVFFTHVHVCHRSPKSHLSSISLSLHNRLTSISAGRQGDWDECVPILTTPLSAPQGLAVYRRTVKWELELSQGSLDCFTVALCDLYLWVEYQIYECACMISCEKVAQAAFPTATPPTLFSASSLMYVQTMSLEKTPPSDAAALSLLPQAPYGR